MQGSQLNMLSLEVGSLGLTGEMCLNKVLLTVTTTTTVHVYTCLRRLLKGRASDISRGCLYLKVRFHIAA